MKRVYFTDIAESSLFEIALWTLQNFGPRQSDVYQSELVDRCAALARGDMPSQSCSVIVGAALAADLRFARVGAHVVVFVDSKDEIVVMDFVHQREDFAAKVTALHQKQQNLPRANTP